MYVVSLCALARDTGHGAIAAGGAIDARNRRQLIQVEKLVPRTAWSALRATNDTFGVHRHVTAHKE